MTGLVKGLFRGIWSSRDTGVTQLPISTQVLPTPPVSVSRSFFSCMSFFFFFSGFIDVEPGEVGNDSWSGVLVYT